MRRRGRKIVSRYRKLCSRKVDDNGSDSTSARGDQRDVDAVAAQDETDGQGKR